MVFGKKYGGLATHSVQIQPTLGVKFDLPRASPADGHLLAALPRRQGLTCPAWSTNAALTLKHEYYGTVQLGNFLSRGWNRPDFPYASDLGQTAFSDAGAAYGILTKALRYTSRELYVADGNLVLEGTYDHGRHRLQAQQAASCSSSGRCGAVARC
jgi:hypothetical protein